MPSMPINSQGKFQGTRAVKKRSQDGVLVARRAILDGMERGCQEGPAIGGCGGTPTGKNTPILQDQKEAGGVGARKRGRALCEMK